MAVLPVELRNKFERTIIEARDVAEAGAKAALEAFAVHHHEFYGHMSPEERKLRNHLRARARQLGDKQHRKGELEITHLIWECAYEHWHQMLFARFLAENDLLIEPEMGVAISKLAEGNGKGRQLLESLIYSYLGDWIAQQKEGVKRGEGGAEDRLAAALELQKLLIAIIEGEPPFDIFVRWKSIEEQPLGWEPDINDGVRLNIRPFLAQDLPGGRMRDEG